MTNEQQVSFREWVSAVGTLRLRLQRARVDGRVRRKVQGKAVLPARSAHRPGDDVLEPAEGRAPVAGLLGEPESVSLLDRVSAPRANDPTCLCSDRACPSR